MAAVETSKEADRVGINFRPQSEMAYEEPLVGGIVGLAASIPLAAMLEIINREAGMNYSIPIVLACTAIGVVSALANRHS